MKPLWPIVTAAVAAWCEWPESEKRWKAIKALYKASRLEKKLLPLIALICLCAPAMAQETHHHAGMSPAVDEFYSTWYRPDHPDQSCCNKLDCYPTAARMVNGHWEAQQRITGNWISVPPAVVEYNREAPDPQAHVCMQPAAENPTVFCFIAAGGT